MIDLFYLIIGIGFVLSLLVQGWLRTTYARWSRVRNSREATGSTVARHVLDQNELWNVTVTLQPGSLTDHYDPRTRTVSLSQRIYQEPSVASAAIAAHECGHAMQDKEGYGPMRLREDSCLWHNSVPNTALGQSWAACPSEPLRSCKLDA